jgi:hypothetical protein
MATATLSPALADPIEEYPEQTEPSFEDIVCDAVDRRLRELGFLPPIELIDED